MTYVLVLQGCLQHTPSVRQDWHLDGVSRCSDLNAENSLLPVGVNGYVQDLGILSESWESGRLDPPDSLGQ